MISWIRRKLTERKDRIVKEKQAQAWRQLLYKAHLLRHSEEWESEAFHYDCGDRD